MQQQERPKMAHNFYGFLKGARLNATVKNERSDYTQEGEITNKLERKGG